MRISNFSISPSRKRAKCALSQWGEFGLGLRVVLVLHTKGTGPFLAQDGVITTAKWEQFAVAPLSAGGGCFSDIIIFGGFAVRGMCWILHGAPSRVVYLWSCFIPFTYPRNQTDSPRGIWYFCWSPSKIPNLVGRSVTLTKTGRCHAWKIES